MTENNLPVSNFFEHEGGLKRKQPYSTVQVKKVNAWECKALRARVEKKNTLDKELVAGSISLGGEESIIRGCCSLHCHAVVISWRLSQLIKK